MLQNVASLKINFKLNILKSRFSRWASPTTEKHGANITIFHGCFVPFEERNVYIYV